MLDVLIVQHADKIRLAGDHGLTPHGHEQAAERGRTLLGLLPVDEFWSSPLRRARETAEDIARTAGHALPPLQVDERLTERLNWSNADDLPQERFLDIWNRTTLEREWQPPIGDSSDGAADRMGHFLLDAAARLGKGRIVVVSHGGVTTDLVRTWFGDETVRQRCPTAFEHGLPSCTVTRMSLIQGHRELHGIAMMEISASSAN